MPKLVSSSVVAALILFGSANAEAAITVDFAFNGNTSEPGSVTGHLTFDEAGTNVKATGLYIDSATGAINPPVSGYQGINFLSGGISYANSFTVSADGVITNASLYVYNSAATYANVARDYIELNYGGGYNLFEQDYASYYQGGYFRAIENSTGLNGVTFSAAAAAVPEPATWAMMILGMGAVGYAMRCRKVIARVAQG